MKMNLLLQSALMVVVVVFSLWVSSQWNARGVSQDLPPPTEAEIPPELLEAPPTTPTPMPSVPEATSVVPANPSTNVPADAGVPVPAETMAQPGLESEVANPTDMPPVEEIPRLSNPNAEGWVYDPTSRRDPFRSYGGSVKVVGPGVTSTDDALLEPLQRFELSSVKVLGVLWDVSRPRALIEDPNKKVHTIYNQTKIGRNQGVVVAIREGEILVQEVFEEEGGPRKSIYVLSIRK